MIWINPVSYSFIFKNYWFHDVYFDGFTKSFTSLAVKIIVVVFCVYKEVNNFSW